jgi:predicted Zn-ribbon and HTH transcriptional regulator
MIYADRIVGNLQLINDKTGEVLINTDYATVDGTVDHTNKEVKFKIGIPELDEWIALGYSPEESVALAKLSEISEECNPVTYEELKEIMDKYAVKPMLMQLAEPEYMCPKCGFKFYLEIRNDKIVLDNKPNACSNCGCTFDWNK